MYDLVGKVFGRLTVVERTPESKNGQGRVYRCLCSCGKEILVPTNRLTTRNTNSCGCLYRELKNNIRSEGVSNFNSLYSNYRCRARTREVPFLLTKDVFESLVTSSCFYCGKSPSQTLNKKGHNGAWLYNGIDRIDNDRGYEEDNCVPCCKVCNIAKHTMTQEEFYRWISSVYNHRVENVNLN